MNRDIAGFRKLDVWKEAHLLVLLLYPVIRDFPKEELFCLVPQMRRAAISVPANIAEGHSRRTSKEFLQFLTIANGSLVEVEYYLELARDLKYISTEQYIALDNQRQKVGMLLHAFIVSVHTKLLDS